MRNADAIIAIIQERGKKGLHLEDVYRQLYNPDLYLKAYGRIYRNDGAMTQGSTAETVDGMSIRKIEGIIELLRNERYRWTPVRRVLIPKKNGKTRPLGIPTWSDKLLQEVIRSLLEAYYEPQFSDSSNGFRPERGCHTALKTIYTGWKGSRWFIEGDIKGCFDNIDHTILLSILREKIRDNRLLTLVANLLDAGYIEEWTYRPTLSGTPQGGIISPLLANIYLDRLDKFVEQTLIPEFTKSRVKLQLPEYSRLQNRITRAKKAGASGATLKPLLKARTLLNSADPFDSLYRRLRYIRYADDFILGFDGPKAEAEDIKERLTEFLRDNLKLELSPEKTLITHAKTEKARFLSYDISTINNPGRPGNGKITLRIPPQVIKDKTNRYISRRKPAPRPELHNDSDLTIIALYGAEYRGYVQYYAYAQNLFWLGHLHYIMRASLLMTLAGKHKSTVTKMAKRFTGMTITDNGKLKCIRIILPREGKEALYAQFGGISLRTKPFAVPSDGLVDLDRMVSRSELESRLRADECELCGSHKDIEVHHIRKLADLNIKGRRERPNWIKVMAARKRKTLTVCRECHDNIHAGRPTRTKNETEVSPF